MSPPVPQLGQRNSGPPNLNQIPWEPGQLMTYQHQQDFNSLALPLTMNGYSMKPEHLWPDPVMNGFIAQAPQASILPQQSSSTRSCCNKDRQAPDHYPGHPSQPGASNLGFEDTTSVYQGHGTIYGTLSSPNMTTSAHVQDFAISGHDQMAYKLNPPYLDNSNPFSSYLQRPLEQHDLVRQAIPPLDTLNGVIGSAAPSANPNLMMREMTDPSLACMCGPGCQCIACASHPYNAATQMRVEELTDIMNENGDFTSNQASRRHTMDGNRFGKGPDLRSVSESLEAHDTSSSAAPQDYEAIGFGGYHNLQYNIGGGCKLGVGLCRCGEGCQCRGCMTHRGHNGP